MNYYVLTTVVATTMAFYSGSLFSSDAALKEAASYRLGIVDKAVLKKVIIEKGYVVLKAEIRSHLFHQSWVDSEIEHKRYTPWIIVQHCAKDDNSELSKLVFGNIYNIYKADFRFALTGSNRLNQLYQKYSNRIDFCTCIHAVDNEELWDSDHVELTTLFYDKASLLKALRAF